VTNYTRRSFIGLLASLPLLKGLGELVPSIAPSLPVAPPLNPFLRPTDSITMMKYGLGYRVTSEMRVDWSVRAVTPQWSDQLELDLDD
jgi:hypothetical protein